MSTPVTIDTDNLTKIVSLIVGCITAGGLIIRFLTKFIRLNKEEEASTKTKITMEEAGASIYKKLQDEIVRLEKIIILQQKEIELVDAKLDALRDLEMDGALDLGQLTMVISSMPCHTCLNPTDSMPQLKEVVDRMARRREDKQTVLKSQSIEGFIKVKGVHNEFPAYE
jgi:nitrate reductase NapAB chaperone NapD